MLGGGLGLGILWFVPEYLGSGDFLRAAARARKPNPDSAAFANHPFVEVFRRSSSVLSAPVYVGGVLAVIVAVRAFIKDRTEGLYLAMAAIATVLMVAVAAMTQAGFAGNLRYVALPAAFVCVLAGAGWVWVVRHTKARFGTVAATALALVVAVASAPFVIQDLRELDMAAKRIRAEAGLYGTIPDAIAAGGGEAKLKSCGSVYTGNFQTQAVAWYMHLHEMQAEIFAFPPGSTIAPSYSALSDRPAIPDDRDDPQVGHRLVLRALMSTYASRPAWSLRRARVVTSAWVLVPLGIGALIAISLLLRTSQLTIGFWIDEGLSVGIADRPLGDIPLALREDGSPPLYYMLLHFWLDVAGRSEAGVRGLSLLFALLAIPAGFWAGRVIWDSTKAAWFAAVLMAFNPFLAQYAQEARMYSLVALLAIPATACFIRAYALDTPRRKPGSRASRSRWRSRCTRTTGRSSSPSAPRSRGRCCGGSRTSRAARELVRDGLLGFGGLFLLYLPWIPTTLYQAAHTGAPWADAPEFNSLLGVPGVLLGRMPQIVLLICAGAGLLILMRRPLSPYGRAAAALIVLAVLTPTIAWTMSQASPAWANRYLAVALPPFVLLAAGGLSYARRLGIVGLVLVVIMWAQDAAPVEKSNVRAVAQNIGPSLAPGDLVISTQPETIPVLHYYLPDGLRYATLTGALTEVGVWDWRDGVERLEATSPERDLKSVIDAQPVGLADRARGAHHLDAQPLARAVDRARPDPVQGMGAVPVERPAAGGDLDPADELHAAAAESGACDGDGEDGLAGSFEHEAGAGAERVLELERAAHAPGQLAPDRQPEPEP